MQREKIVSINGLKGFSCIVIMLYHYRFFLLDNGIMFIDYGHYFVEVFVTISGFLIAYNYKDKIANMTFKEFFFRRYMKIMPLYWITELCMYLAVIFAMVLSGEKRQWNILQILWEFSGIYTGWFGQKELPLNNPLWTVCCILFCYMLYYLIIKISRNFSGIYIGAILFVLSSGLSIIWLTHEKIDFLFVRNEDLVRCILSFMIGVLLCEAYQRLPKRWGKRISYTLLILIIGVIACSSTSVIDDIVIEKSISSFVIFIVCPFMVYSAIYIPLFKFIFSTRILQLVGILSMDIYMWHWVVRVYLGSRPFYLEQRTWFGFCVLIITSLLVSGVSHYVVMPYIYSIRGKREKNVL